MFTIISVSASVNLINAPIVLGAPQLLRASILRLHLPHHASLPSRAPIGPRLTTSF